ncbi:MAG TPA: energy transducer TonB [Candidatus Sulfotelmatobacter sp.]|nr:energy transducer TonB [Candidatus Sulfotelmatobacter sp.]
MSIIRTCSNNLLVLLFFISPAYLSTADANGIEAGLRQSYEQKLLSLRNPYCGKNLNFDSGGNVMNQAVAGPWSTCGLMQAQKLKLIRDGVEIDGKRVILALRSGEGEPATPPKMQVVPVLTNEDVRIRMQAQPVSTEQVNNALAQVFQGGQLLDRVAAYWKPNTTDLRPSGLKAFRASTPDGIVGELEGNRPVYMVKAGLTEPPQAIYQPEPEYTEAARSKRLEGTALLLVIINEKGLPEVLEIVQGLGEGLDVHALSTVARWRFHPASKDGKPVAVLVYVEVAFHLR